MKPCCHCVEKKVRLDERRPSWEQGVASYQICVTQRTLKQNGAKKKKDNLCFPPFFLDLVFPPPRSLLTSCFPPSLNASHLIVTWVEANHTLGRKRKKKDTLELLSKTKTAGLCSQKSIAHAQASGCLGRKRSIQKWCLFVCEHVSGR